MIPEYDLDLQRSHPQMSDLYMVIQQPERFSEGPYLTDREWLDWEWACQINGAPAADPVTQLTVNNGTAAANLLGGMTVLIGSNLGDWDKGIVRLRGDQACNPATNTLNIATSSELFGTVEDDDWVVVLDEFRLWQIFGRIDVDPVAETLDWYKDYDIEWTDLALNDTNRRIAMIPPVPIMGPHAVKFVEAGDDAAQFWFDWSDSYDPSTNPLGVVNSWDSWGETDHLGGTWNSAAQVPGWQTFNWISGLRGFRVWLEVDNGYGNLTTLPYRRGVRYVFTLRRPGQRQAHDPPNAEPIVHFRLDSEIAGSFAQGYWRTSITVYEDEAWKYNIMPGALVILFTEDWYMQDSPYLSPRGLRKESVGPIFDRENILMVGRIDGSSIVIDSDTKDVSFDIISTGEEAALYQNYPIVINYDTNAVTWIDTPNLNIDGAIRYYTAWHTTLSVVTDVYRTEDTHNIRAQDFLQGDIYSTLNQFLKDRLFARLLFDKYGRAFCEVDANMQPFGSVDTLWSLEDQDCLDKITVKRTERNPVNAAEAGGIIYFGGDIVPKLSRAPGSFDAYRGMVEASNNLAIQDQDELNGLSGRYYNALNHKWEMELDHAGNWRWLDIVPQAAYYIASMETERGVIELQRMIIREVSNKFEMEAGCIFTSSKAESEEPDRVGVTVDIPEELPEPDPPDDPLPEPYDPIDPVVDSGRRIIATPVGVFVTDDIGAAHPHWYAANSGIPTAALRCWKIIRDPWHWWTSGGTERTLWGIFNRNYGGSLGNQPFYVYKHENFPYGTWQLVFSADLIGGVNTLANAILDIHGSIEQEDWIYIAGREYHAGLDASSGWLIRTTDGGAIWQLRGEFCPYVAGYGGSWIGHQIWYTDAYGIDMGAAMDLGEHLAGQRAFVFYTNRQPAVALGPYPLVFTRTQDGGTNWTPLTSPGTATGTGAMTQINALTVPYVNGAWPDSDANIKLPLTGVDAMQWMRSVDTGGSWNNVGAMPANYNLLGAGVCPTDRLTLVAFGNHVNAATYLARIQISHDGGASWSTWKSLSYRLSPGVFIKWNGSYIDTFLCFEKGPASDISVRLLTAAGDLDKTGDLFSAGAVVDVSRIERDTMGAA